MMGLEAICHAEPDRIEAEKVAMAVAIAKKEMLLLLSNYSR